MPATSPLAATALVPNPPQPAAATVRPQAPDFKFSRRGEAAAQDTVSCPMCGSSNTRALRFCVTCGHVLIQAPAPAAQPAPAPAPAAPAAPAPSVDDLCSTVIDPPRAAAPAPVALTAPAAPIAPARVVDIGTAQHRPAAPRVCSRCRGTSDANAQFCKFCGAPLGEPAQAAPQASASWASVAPQASASWASVAPQASASWAGAAPQPSPAPIASPVVAPQPATNSIAAARAANRPVTAPLNPPAGVQPAPTAAAAPAPVVPAPAVVAPAPAPAVVPAAPAVAAAPSRTRLVLIARDGGEGPTFPVSDVTDIGRTEGHVLISDDRYVSPRHARIHKKDGFYFIRDLGSVNGVFLRIPFTGGAHSPRAPRPPADTEQVLEDQDLFLVGQQVLRFEVVKDAEEGFGAASQHGTLLFGTPSTPRYARLSQRTVEGITRDVFYIRKAETILGRESGDVVFTEDPFLSRRHAVVRLHSADKHGGGKDGPRRFALVDLGSSNGTFLQLREEVSLRSGDQFRIGQQLFRFDDGP
jgi:pSer/pThr/pTyr-binding forkhead associated (FHA) protein